MTLPLERFLELENRGYQVDFLSHAQAILTEDFPDALSDLQQVLERLEIPVEALIKGGGGEHALTQLLRRNFTDLGWKKHKFEIEKRIDGMLRESISHEVDHVKEFGLFRVALEIEWNNKDPFFDRDLENFKRLHGEGAISVGCIITRGQSFQENIFGVVQSFAQNNSIKNLSDINRYYNLTEKQKERIQRKTSVGESFAESWASVFVSDKFGSSTTHWQKLQERIRRGVGSPCPLLLIGIPIEAISQ